jgi:hypothetical protein
LFNIFFGERRRRSPILAQYLGENIANNKQSASRALSSSLGGEHRPQDCFFINSCQLLCLYEW